MMRIALCLIKRLGWWCEDMQSFKNYYLVGTVPLNSIFLQSLLSLDFDIGRVGLYLMDCMKLLIQAARGYLGLHYAKNTSGEEPEWPF